MRSRARAGLEERRFAPAGWSIRPESVVDQKQNSWSMSSEYAIGGFLIFRQWIIPVSLLMNLAFYLIGIQQLFYLFASISAVRVKFLINLSLSNPIVPENHEQRHPLPYRREQASFSCPPSHVFYNHSAFHCSSSSTGRPCPSDSTWRDWPPILRELCLPLSVRFPPRVLSSYARERFCSFPRCLRPQPFPEGI